MIYSMDFNKLKEYLNAGKGKVSDFIDQNNAAAEGSKQQMADTQANVMQKYAGTAPDKAQALAKQGVDMAGSAGTSMGSLISAPTAAEAVLGSAATPNMQGNILNVVKDEAKQGFGKIIDKTTKDPAITLTPTMLKLRKLMGY